MLVELDVEYGKSLRKEEAFSLTRSPIKKTRMDPKMKTGGRPARRSAPG